MDKIWKPGQHTNIILRNGIDDKVAWALVN